MKTLILNGSPKRNGDVEFLINEFCSQLGGEIMTISYFQNISPCIDCRYCWEHDECSIKDDMSAVYDYLQESDNVIIASPIWFSSLSGPLLNIASRFQRYFITKHYNNKNLISKRKNGVIILAGAEKGTEVKAIETAKTILKHINTSCVSVVLSLNTNHTSASKDMTLNNQIKDTTNLLNELYLKNTK